MTYNKLVIRRLPPSMNEDDFLEQVGPLADHDYFCFFEAISSTSCHSYSRAYINFSNRDDMQAFLQRFDNHVFLDKHGHEYPAVVEQSFWHKSATSGPFYKKRSESTNGKEATLNLEEDQEFLEFVDRLQKRNSPQSPIQTIDELTNASTSKKDKQNNSTPLLDYVNRVRIMKNTKRTK